MGAFMVGEVEVVNEVSLAPSAALYDGAVVADGDLTVRVNQFFYDLAGTKGKYLGSVGNAVTDATTNYVYLNSGAGLVINTTGYPGTTHIRLARVIAAGGIITRVVLERALLSAGGAAVVNPDASFSAGNFQVGTSTTVRYLTPGFDPATTSPTTAVQIRSPVTGTLKNLHVRHGTVGSGGNISYTARVNSVASSVVATLAASASSGQDTTNTVAVTMGDLIDIQVTKAAGIASSPQNVICTFEIQG